jgi:hypothetical protein
MSVLSEWISSITGQMAKMPLAEHDNVVETFTPY